MAMLQVRDVDVRMGVHQILREVTLEVPDMAVVAGHRQGQWRRQGLVDARAFPASIAARVATSPSPARQLPT